MPFVFMKKLKKKQIITIVIAALIGAAIIAFPFIWNAAHKSVPVAETVEIKELPKTDDKAFVSFPVNIDPEEYAVVFRNGPQEKLLFYPTARFTYIKSWPHAAEWTFDNEIYDVTIHIGLHEAEDGGYTFGLNVLVKVNYVGLPYAESNPQEPTTIEAYYLGDIADQTIELANGGPPGGTNYYQFDVKFDFFHHQLDTSGPTTVHHALGMVNNKMIYSIGDDPNNGQDESAFSLEMNILNGVAPTSLIIQDEDLSTTVPDPINGDIHYLTPLYIDLQYGGQSSSYEEGYNAGKQDTISNLLGNTIAAPSYQWSASNIDATYSDDVLTIGPSDNNTAYVNLPTNTTLQGGMQIAVVWKSIETSAQNLDLRLATPYSSGPTNFAQITKIDSTSTYGTIYENIPENDNQRIMLINNSGAEVKITGLEIKLLQTSSESYDNGYNAGYAAGQGNAGQNYNNGYKAGYAEGSAAGSESSNFADLFTGIFGSLLAFGMTVGDGVTIWGLSLFEIVISFVAIIIIVKVVKNLV